MGSDKQIQKAGDGSQQNQATYMIINNGITEERARAICSEVALKAIAECTEEAEKTAKERIDQFAGFFIPRLQQIEEGFQSFTDPAFQVLLRKAQLTAACTGCEENYKILSELLVHRVKNRENVKKKASITKAVEILDQIDEDSLLGLTVFHSMRQFAPTTGEVKQGLNVLDSLYAKYDLDNLPTGDSWIDNLAILGAITTSSVGSLKKFPVFLTEVLSGYVCAGIKKESEEYEKAIEILRENGLATVFIDNELLEGYSRISTPNLSVISNVTGLIRVGVKDLEPSFEMPVTVTPNDIQRKAILSIISMYDNNISLINQVKERFNNMLTSFPAISKAIAWWDSLKPAILLSSVGRVIAHTNAKSIDPTLPELD